MTLVQEWNNTFSQIQREWQSIKEKHISVREQAQKKVVADWDVLIESIYQEQAQLRHEGKWVSGPSDLLSIIGRSRRETYHCAIIAWLLDPCAPHGLGTIFLEKMLQRCVPDEVFQTERLIGAVPKCEVVMPNCRADIVVYAPDLTVVVEAKVDSGERDRQCADIYKDFHEEPGAQFVFLTPDGKKPVTESDETKAFQTLSFKDIYDDLSSIADKAKPDNKYPAAFFTIRTYLETLKAEFHGT